MPRPGQFHHIVIEVANLERSEKFYTDAIGLDPAGRDIFPEDGPTSAFKTSEGQYVVLLQVQKVTKDGPGVHTNFELATPDYWAIHERLDKLGCLVIDHRAEQRTVGEVSQYFNDPDGHRLQITAYDLDAFQVPPAKLGKIVAGRLEDFPLGSVTHVKAGKFFIVRLKDGILALNQVCTHMQSNVVYEPEHYRFYCASHYNKFTRIGEHIGHTPGTPPLHTYALEIVDGQVVVDTDTSIPRRPEEADQMVGLPA